LVPQVCPEKEAPPVRQSRAGRSRQRLTDSLCRGAFPRHAAKQVGNSR
jgi:hypothetical protein